MKEPRLSLAFVRQVRTPGKYYDSFGLILVVSAGGAKRWIQRLTVNGRRRDIGLGSALTTTPAAARAMAAKNREVARAGGNPLAGVKDRPVPTPRKGMSLAGFSRAVNLRGLALGDKRAARERYAALSRHLHPILGRQLLRDLTPEMIHGALMRIREEKARTAMTVRGHLIALLGEAVSDGLIPENPADRLETRIPAPAKLTTAGGDAKAARVLDQLPAFLEAMMTTSRRPNLMRLLRFMLLTLRAPQECRLARWEQFDIPGRSWTFPLRQHEGNEIQRFELFDVHLDILHEARHVARGDGTGWVFDATAGMDRPYEVNATYKARRDLGFDIEVLDFRRAHEFWVRGRDGDGSLKGWIDLLLKSKAAPSPNPGISLP